MRVMYLPLVAVVTAAVISCESDEKKMQRLQSDQLVACFEDEHPNSADQQAHNMDPDYKQTSQQRAHTVDSLRLAIHAKCGLATRDLNRFMNGR